MKAFRTLVYILHGAVVIWAGVNFFSGSAEPTEQPVELIDSTAVDTSVTTPDSVSTTVTE